jgi:hypothetical protein
LKELFLKSEIYKEMQQKIEELEVAINAEKVGYFSLKETLTPRFVPNKTWNGSSRATRRTSIASERSSKVHGERM